MCFPGAIVLLSNSLPHNAAIVQQAIGYFEFDTL